MVADYAVTMTVVGVFGFLAVWGEPAQVYLHEWRLSRHACRAPCNASRRCKCGCRDGIFGILAGTCCAVCGAQFKFVEDDEESWLNPARLIALEPEEERGSTGDE